MRRGMEFSLCFSHLFGSNWDRRYFFHVGILRRSRICGLKSIYCDGWVIIVTFSWRQRRYLLDIRMLAGADFITSQVMLGAMFLSFSFQMCTDIIILLEYFLFENKSLSFLGKPSLSEERGELETQGHRHYKEIMYIYIYVYIYIYIYIFMEKLYHWYWALF